MGASSVGTCCFEWDEIAASAPSRHERHNSIHERRILSYCIYLSICKCREIVAGAGNRRPLPARPRRSPRRRTAPPATVRPCRSARFQESPRPVISGDAGRVAEWFKAAVLKTAVGASSPWVRIPPLPPQTKDVDWEATRRRGVSQHYRSSGEPMSGRDHPAIDRLKFPDNCSAELRQNRHEGDADQGGNQAVLDCGCAALVLNKLRNGGQRWSALVRGIPMRPNCQRLL